jgi:hypothetical protein
MLVPKLFLDFEQRRQCLEDPRQVGASAAPTLLLSFRTRLRPRSDILFDSLVLTLIICDVTGFPQVYRNVGRFSASSPKIIIK